MLRGLEGWHILIIVGAAVLLFGSRKLPDAARSVGQSLRIFKSEMKAAAKDETPGGPTAAATPQAAVEAGTIQAPSVADSVPTKVAESR